MKLLTVVGARPQFIKAAMFSRAFRKDQFILTDSEGVWKEAYFHHVPCVTLREETEWSETVFVGWNALAGADFDRIVSCVESAHTGKELPEFGDGHAAKEILRIIQQEICR